MSSSPNESRRPADTPFKQQRLAAWQPVLSPPWVISCFLVFALIFIPIGVAIIISSDGVTEIEIRYDNAASTPFSTPSDKFVSDGDGRTLLRWISFTVPQDMSPPIYMYYSISNFYQNHRRYARSRSDNQLAGQQVAYDSLSDCSPFVYAGQIRKQDYNGSMSQVYSPCGLIAWSMFNDSLGIVEQTTAAPCEESNLNTPACPILCIGDYMKTPTESKCSKGGIAWPSDKKSRYLKAFPGQYSQGYYQGEEKVLRAGTTDTYYEGHIIPQQDDEDFMVWMRIASLSDFRKLYRIINSPLKKGQRLYLRVIDRFNIERFEGKKSMLLSTTAWMGGKNYFLGVLYVVIGCLCFLLFITFAIKYFFVLKKRSNAP